MSEDKDIVRVLYMLKPDKRQEVILELLTQINSKQSKNMLLYHLISISPLKNMKYALKKLVKSFKK